MASLLPIVWARSPHCATILRLRSLSASIYPSVRICGTASRGTSMVHSMTAFARVEKAGVQGTLSWELRSVNSRYLEPHLRLPESFRDLEGAVREALRQRISRGKLECTLRFTEETTGKPLQVDRERAAQLVAAAETIAGLIKQPAALNPLEVLAWPGVLVADASDPQALNAEALTLFTQGLKELKAGREREGAELARLINERLTSIEA